MRPRKVHGMFNRKRSIMRPFLLALEGRIVPAQFVVDGTIPDVPNNPTPGSLRYAVESANDSPNDGSPDEITIIKMGTIPMSAPLVITESVVIDPFGASDVTIDFSGMTQSGAGFNVCIKQTSDTGTVTFDGLTITGVRDGPAISGMDRDVTIRNCEITGNTNSGPGGGVYFSSASVKTLTIVNSCIAENVSGKDGGGVFVKGGVSANELVVIHNSTISSNTAKGNGGAVAFGGLAGIAVMRFATVTANTANGSGSKGGGLFLGDNGMAIVSSIVSGNTNTGSNSPDIYGAVALDRYYTAVGSGSGFTTGKNVANLSFGTNLLLGALPAITASTTNGGETRTHALLAGSPAINAGFNQFPAIFINDQRGPGFPRPTGNLADIGAYESSANPFAHSKRMDVTTAGATTFNVVVTYTDDKAINVSTIDVNDIKVTGPNGFSAAANSVTVNIGTNGTPRVATYTFTAPVNGNTGWDFTDNGTYSATMQANQVLDIDGNAVPSVALGDFYVGIAIVVDELGDATIANGKTSIREAIAAANAITNGPTIKTGIPTPIVFDPTVFATPTTIQLNLANGGELKIASPVSIFGPTAGLTLSGGNTSRIFNVDVNNANFTDPALRVVNISGLTLVSGNTSGTGGAVFVQDDRIVINNSKIIGNKATVAGGGIGTGTGGSVMLFRTTVAGNSVTGGGGINGGGGVFLSGNGILSVDSSTISGNSCPNSDGGGVYVSNSSSRMNFVNSTVSGNSGRRGGGIFLNQFLGTFTVFNTTITNNTAATIPDGGGILVGGVAGTVGTVTLSSTILAGNFGVNGPDLEFLAPLANQKVAGDNNLVGVANVGNFTLTGVGNFTGTGAIPLNPNIGPLANNGGPTQTHAILPGSVALSAGNNFLCLAYDQRGFLLDQNKQFSIGSFGTNLAGAARVTQVTINSLKSGTDKTQRSRVTDVAIAFDSAVTFVGNPAAAFTLNKVGGGAVNLAATVSSGGGGTVVTLTFTGGNVDNISLADGRYALHALAAQFGGAGLDGDGNGTGGDDFIFDEPPSPSPLDTGKIFRLFGDFNGDGTVAANDFIQFRLALGGTSFAFDFDNDGAVATSDFIQFRLRFGGSI